MFTFNQCSLAGCDLCPGYLSIMRATRTLPVILAVAAVALAVAGCGGSDDSGGEKTTPAASVPVTTGGDSTQAEPMVTTGMAKCTESEIAKAVEQTGSQEAGEATLAPGADNYKCADGWAVAFANVGEGQEQYTTTLVFEAEGQFWVSQDRAKVCPEPSDVPKAIYDLACNSN